MAQRKRGSQPRRLRELGFEGEGFLELRRSRTVNATHLIAPLIAIIASATPCVAQTDARLVTGQAAAAAFSHLGKPIHPFCVWFSQEGQSRSTPNDLATCSDSTVVPRVQNGWATAMYPDRGGYSSYRVLARKGERFLLGLESSGGGSGKFSDLSWVSLGATRVTDAKDVSGGDRCAGGLSAYSVDGRTLRFAADASTTAIFGLAAVSLPSALRARLNAGYSSCDGTANYRYDLASEVLTFASVTLSVRVATAPADTTAVHRDPQTCFDELARQAAVARRTTLTLAELKRFTDRFLAECAR